jgi:hypothetical protein
LFDLIKNHTDLLVNQTTAGSVPCQQTQKIAQTLPFKPERLWQRAATQTIVLFRERQSTA